MSYLDEAYLDGLGADPVADSSTWASKAGSLFRSAAGAVIDSTAYSLRKGSEVLTDAATGTSQVQRDQAEAARQAALAKAASAKKTQTLLLLVAVAAVAIYFYTKKK